MVACCSKRLLIPLMPTPQKTVGDLGTHVSQRGGGVNLHSLWRVYTNCHLLRSLGTLKVSESGFVYWESAAGITALCQFHDNMLIATTSPTRPCGRFVIC